MVLLFIIIFTILVLFLVHTLLTRNPLNFEPAYKKAGKAGEIIATDYIKRYLDTNDLLFSNCSVDYDGRFTELDNVIVNRYGVFIVEVKNYSGALYGNENDYEWKKLKTTGAGNVYEKTVRNPVKQVKRQIFLLSKYLQHHGIDVWVEGYVFLINNNSPIQSNFILSANDDLYRKFHTKSRAYLDKSTLLKIHGLLSNHSIH